LEEVDLTLPDGVSAPPEGVEVLLEVDATGQVTSAQLEQSLGEAGDQRVLEVVRALRFEPARRGDRTLAARVRLRLAVSTPPPPVLVPQAGTAPGATTAAPGAEPRAASDPLRTEPVAPVEPAAEEEAPASFSATARVERRAPGAASQVRLRGQELTHVPGTFGEPLRVVATLPGVAHTPYGLGFFLVRGASFQNTGFLVDGFPVPLLYHLGAGPAILSSRLVSQLDFYPGGYPVAFGRYSAGIISLRTQPPPTDRVQLEVELDLLRGSALAIVPYGDGDGSVAVALRRSYYELFLPLITDDVSLSYTDYQLRLDHHFGRRFTASVFVFGSRDSLYFQPSSDAATTGESSTGFTYGFDQVILSLQAKPVPALRLRWSGTVGRNSIDVESQRGSESSLGGEIDALRLGQRLEAVLAPIPELQTTLGLEENLLSSTLSGAAPSFAELPGIPPPSSNTKPIAISESISESDFAPYFEQVLRPGPFELTLGLRSERMHYGFGKHWTFDPRSVVRWKLGKVVTIKLASGLFGQPPLPHEVARTGGEPRLRPTRSWQSSTGVELALPHALEIDSTLFYSAMSQLSRPGGEPQTDQAGNPVVRFYRDDGRGRAYGFELLVRRRLERGLFGWISYTLSRSERFVEQGDPVVFFFDQTHVLNVAASYGIAGWRFGMRFALATGRPVGDVLDPSGVKTVFDTDSDDYDGSSAGQRTRLPTFHQLDVRIDREFRIGPIDASAYLDVMNAYNSPNSEGYQYSYDLRERARLPGLPFLPTIGIRGVLR
jgi:TonB family protein